MTVGIRFHASIAAALALGILSCLAAASPLRAQSPDDGSWQGTPWEQRMGVPYFEKRAGQGDAEAAAGTRRTRLDLARGATWPGCTLS